MKKMLEVLNPVAIRQGEVGQCSLAPRPKSLNGKKVGLLWNGKRNGDIALARAGELLKSRFRDVQLIRIDSTTTDHFPPEVMEYAKKECEVAIGSTGD